MAICGATQGGGGGDITNDIKYWSGIGGDLLSCLFL